MSLAQRMRAPHRRLDADHRERPLHVTACVASSDGGLQANRRLAREPLLSPSAHLEDRPPLPIHPLQTHHGEGVRIHDRFPAVRCSITPLGRQGCCRAGPCAGAIARLLHAGAYWRAPRLRHLALHADACMRAARPWRCTQSCARAWQHAHTLVPTAPPPLAPRLPRVVAAVDVVTPEREEQHVHEQHAQQDSDKREEPLDQPGESVGRHGLLAPHRSLLLPLLWRQEGVSTAAAGAVAATFVVAVSVAANIVVAVSIAATPLTVASVAAALGEPSPAGSEAELPSHHPVGWRARRLRLRGCLTVSVARGT